MTSKEKGHSVDPTFHEDDPLQFDIAPTSRGETAFKTGI